jgi:hypothetical protein
VSHAAPSRWGEHPEVVDPTCVLDGLDEYEVLDALDR